MERDDALSPSALRNLGLVFNALACVVAFVFALKFGFWVGVLAVLALMSASLGMFLLCLAATEKEARNG